MGEEPKDNDDLIRAAGRLVWRYTPQGKVLAVVHRRRHGGDWTLPKGKLEAGESWLDGAVREVEEETGCQVEVGRFAGVIGYTVDDKPKVVRFWNMTVVGDPGKPKDNEVDQVEWLSARDAVARVQYPLEKALIESTWLAAEASEDGPHSPGQ